MYICIYVCILFGRVFYIIPICKPNTIYIIQLTILRHMLVSGYRTVNALFIDIPM